MLCENVFRISYTITYPSDVDFKVEMSK